VISDLGPERKCSDGLLVKAVPTNRVQVVQLKRFEETMNWNAHYTADCSAGSTTNGVLDGGVFMNMLPKDNIDVVQ